MSWKRCAKNPDASFFQPFAVTHKIIVEGAEMRDDDDPNQLVVLDAGLVGGAVDQHPDPKRQCGQGDWHGDEHTKGSSSKMGATEFLG
jgi:hypothetical protein